MEVDEPQGAAAPQGGAASAITGAQLAAALMNVGGGGFLNRTSGNAAPGPLSAPSLNPLMGLAGPSQPPNPSQAPAGPAASPDMLNLLQNALRGSASAAPAPSQPLPAPAAPLIPDLEENLAMMNEMGLPDAAVNRQALVATNGDLAGAVELVFAQMGQFSD